MWPWCPMDPSRDCSCPGGVIREASASSPCLPRGPGRAGGASSLPPRPTSRLELEEEPRSGGGQISGAGAQYCVPVWWVDSATESPQRVQEGSISRDWGTEHLSTGAVALRSVKTSAVGLAIKMPLDESLVLHSSCDGDLIS